MIDKVFYDNCIPICFSANSEFIPYTAVMIRSIIEHARRDVGYDIVILYSEMDASLADGVRSLANEWDNVSIRFYDVSGLVENFDFFTESVYTKSPYSREVYYRLLIPTLMPDYDKVIYLDGDMIATCDVADLYDTDMSDFLIAAPRDYAGIAHCYTDGDDRLEYRRDILGISNVDDYIISGTVIFNTKLFNARYTAQSLMEFAASREWRQHDQDVLNTLCEGEIRILDGAWNYLFDNSLIKNLPPRLYSEFLLSEEKPKIIHFAGERKPKANKPVRYSDLFWNLAKKTPFYELLMQK